MFARAPLPDEFRDWNRRHLAPNGPAWWHRLLHSRVRPFLEKSRFKLPAILMRVLGPFAFQENSGTRAFEFPWVYSTLRPSPGMTVIDVGAGASGLQFALASKGVRVTSVDPLLNPSESVDWVFTEREFARLNRAFGNRVEFIKKFLQDADLPSAAYDAIISVSVIEHVPDEAIAPLMREINRLLKPGGRFIATIDLFTDCAPFTEQRSNRWGSNRDVRALVEVSGLRLHFGDPRELYGFPEFSVAHVETVLDSCVRDAGVLTQLLVLEKPL